jgi:hypothetical protein
MIELLLPYGFDTLEYSWVKATIGICTLADYSMAKKHQHRYWMSLYKDMSSHNAFSDYTRTPPLYLHAAHTLPF